MPRSVQQSIPIDRIYADGVWQSENVFSLMWQISDINYAMQSDAAKQNILTQLGTVYAGIPLTAGCKSASSASAWMKKPLPVMCCTTARTTALMPSAPSVTAKSRPTPAKMEMWCSISTSSCPRTNPA
ncbi:hypothetical protein NIA69_06470 [Gemmiger formicilis]|nr:hypothetical protein [Gemmiger formicilis]